MFVEHNNGWHTTSTEPGGSFMAMFQGVVDGTQEVTDQGTPEYGRLMCIGSSDGVVYITREQAMAFFNLVNP